MNNELPNRLADELAAEMCLTSANRGILRRYLERELRPTMEALERISNGNDAATMREWAQEALRQANPHHP